MGKKERKMVIEKKMKKKETSCNINCNMKRQDNKYIKIVLWMELKR